MSRVFLDANVLFSAAIMDEPPAHLVEELAPLVPDLDDAPILAGAVSGEADLLVTGNERDFRTLYGMEVRGGLTRSSSQRRARPPHALRKLGDL